MIKGTVVGESNIVGRENCEMNVVRKKIKQLICLLMTMAMIGTMMPQTVVTAYAQEESSILDNEVVEENDSVLDNSSLEEDESVSDTVISKDASSVSGNEVIEEDSSESVSEETEEDSESVSEETGEDCSESETEETGEDCSESETEETGEDCSESETEETEENSTESETEETEENTETENETLEELNSVSEDIITKNTVSGNSPEENEGRKSIQILADDEAVEISARIGAQAIDYEPVEGGFAYKVTENETLTVTVTAKYNYKISGAVTSIKGLADKTERVKEAGFVYSVKATDDSVTTITTEALNKGLLKYNDNEIEKVKEVYTVAAGSSYSAEVLYGNQIAEIENADIEQSESEKTTVTVSEDKKSVALFVGEEEAGNQKLKLKVTTGEGTVVTYALNVRPDIQTISVKGVSKGVLKQTVDTNKEYKVTIKPAKADLDSLYVVTEGDVEASFADGILKVTTKAEVKDAAGVIRFFKKGIDGEDGTEIQNTAITVQTIAPTVLEKSKPTVKVAETTDTEITLNLSAAKTIEEPAQGALYYEIKVTPDDAKEVPDNILQATKNPIYRLKTGVSQKETIIVNTAEAGQGEVCKFSVEVRIVQLSEKKEASAVTEEDVNGANAYSSKSAKVSASTLKPAYETKLGIKKGTTTVYTGQSDVVIGTPTFNKKTSYRTITEVKDITENLTEEQKLQVEYKEGKLVATVPAGTDIAIGKHTIIAYADAPAGSKAASATIVVTVVRGIEDISVSVNTNALYKQYNKAAVLTVKPVYNTSVTAELPEPKTKKVSYAVVDKDRNAFTQGSPLYGMVTVKNGKVTVNKNFIVSSNTDNNIFCIKVSATDFKGNTVSAYSEPIEIKSTTVALGEVVLVSDELNENAEYAVVSRGNETLKLEQFNTSRIAVVKTGIDRKDAYAAEELLDVTMLSVNSNSKAVKISADGKVSAEQTANNVTITVTTTDGSKGKAVLSKLKLEYTTPLALGVNISRATYSYMSDTPEFYSISSPDNTTVSYQAANNEIFKIEVMKQDSAGNWKTIEPEECMNYTLAITGGKQLSKDKDTYLIMATVATTKITITDKTNQNLKTVYTLTNEGMMNKTLNSLKATVKDSLVAGHYGSTQSVTFEVNAGGSYSYYDADGITKYAQIRVDATAAQKNKPQYTSLLNATSGIDGYHQLDVTTNEEYNDEGEIVSSDTVVSFAVSFDEKTYTDIVAGNYKLNITLGEIIGGDFVADTKTISVTLKAVEQKKLNISFKPDSKYAISAKDNKSIVLSGKLNDENASYQYTGVHNVIADGEVNQFTDFFEFISAEGKEGAKIKLKSGVDASYLMSSEGKKHCNAYVDYAVYDKNGVLFKTDSVNITVTVKEDPVETFKMTVLPVVKRTDGSSMSTTVTVTRGGKAVNISHAFVASGSFTATTDGSSVVTLTTNTLPSRGSSERIELYMVPEGSCYEQELTEYQNAGNTSAYQQKIQEYGIKYRGNIKFQENNARLSKVSLSGYAQFKESYFSREAVTTGVYTIPLSYTKKCFVEIKDISIESIGANVYEDWPEEYKFVEFKVGKDSKGSDVIFMIMDKAKMAAARNNGYIESRTNNIKLQLDFGEGIGTQSATVKFSVPNWQTYEKAEQLLDKYTNYKITQSWKADKEQTVQAVQNNISRRLSKSIRYDSDAVLTITVDEASVVEPTRLTNGEVKVAVQLVNTMPGEDDEVTKKDYTITVEIPAKGAWPEDIADDLNTYLTGYQTEENPHVFNHTIAENIAEDIKKQDFIKNHGQFKVDVTNLTKEKATELADGSCKVRIRIVDTSGRGAAYDQYWTWPIYQLSTLEETGNTITKKLSAVEATNRTDKEAVEAWIDSAIYNKDIVWSWKEITVDGKKQDDYTKKLSTHEEHGSITGSIIMQNPKSVIDATLKQEVQINIQLQKMTDPAEIYSKINGVVGTDALSQDMFYVQNENDMEDESDRQLLSKAQMMEMVLDKANGVLKEAGEMYYVEYDKDEDEKDKFEYCPMTYKTDASVSYTLVIKNEFTDEVVGEKLVVEHFVLKYADGSLQTLKNWKTDIQEYVQVGNESGIFKNAMDEYDVVMMAENLRTNSSFSASPLYNDEGETDFVKTPATLDTTGWITMTLVLYETAEDDAGTITKSETVSVKLIIPEISQSMEEAQAAVNETVVQMAAENAISNATTADDILNTAKTVLKKSKYQVVWSVPYSLTEASTEAEGSIKGELTIQNLAPAAGESSSATVAIDFTIAELKTAEEAEAAVRAAVTGDAVFSFVESSDADSVKAAILERANEAVKYDGYVVAFKKSGTTDVFEYLASTYKADGYISYTLLFADEEGNESVEIVQENTVLPLDVTKQTVVKANADIKTKFTELTSEGTITNEITAEELLNAAKTVVVNPGIDVSVWTEEAYGKNGSIQYVSGGKEMQVMKKATTRTTGKLTISLVMRTENESGQYAYKAYYYTVVIPKITE